MKQFKEIKNRDILSHFEMDKIKGGNGTCGYKLVHIATGVIETECNISIDDIQIEMDHATYLETEKEEQIRFNWCCDSCGSSTYCGA